MDKSTTMPAPAASRFRVPVLAWVGMTTLAVSLAGVGLGFHGPASAGSAPTSANGSSESRRTFAFGHVDVEGGVISLYPLAQGRVVKVYVTDNKAVKARDPLFRMDDTLAKDTLAEAKADLAAATQQLKQAEEAVKQHDQQVKGQQTVIAAKQREFNVAKLKRDEADRLVSKKLAHEDVLKMAEEMLKGLEEGLQGERIKLDALKNVDPKVGVARAQQGVNAAEARLAKARFALDECTVVAPCDGTVLRLLVTEGEVLGFSARQPAVFFCPKKPRIIRAEVEQEYADRVVPNQTAKIVDDTRTGITWKGKVVRVSDWFTHRRSILMEPLQFNDVRTLECIIELVEDSTAQPLRIGQRVRVELDGSAK